MSEVYPIRSSPAARCDDEPVGVLDAILPRPLDRRGISSLAFGHLSVDFSQGIVPPLLPFLIRDRGYTYAEAGSLLLFSSLGSALLQPLLGAFADRIRAGWMLYVGPLLAAIGVGAVGFTNAYNGTALALAVMSVGVAMYHPEAVRSASRLSAAASLQGTGVSIFAVGGMTGWALGPLLLTPMVLLFGLEGIVFCALVPGLAGILLWRVSSHLESYERAAVRAGAELGESRWLAFWLAAFAATMRTGVQYGIQTYVGLMIWRELDTSEAIGNLAITVFLLAGALGTQIGGRMSDRVGFDRVVVYSLAATIPLALAIPHLPLLPLFAVLVVCGIISEANFYPLVVLSQRAVPAHAGFASGVMLGLSIGIGALIVAGLGRIADARGLGAALTTCGLLAVLAFLAVLPLGRLLGSRTT